MITVLGARGSKSRNFLAQSLGVKRGAPDQVRRCKGRRFVINWGVGVAFQWHQRVLDISNSLQSVKNCSNKIQTLERCRVAGLPILQYAVGYTAAEANTVGSEPRTWLDTDGKIVARHTVTGHSGAGIQIVRKGEDIPQAPLYTRYFKKNAEYRVHVFYGKAILIQQKKRMREERRPDAQENNNNDLIRTHSNGWTFATRDLDCDTRNYRDRLVELAIRAAAAVGVNHCAVDILSNHNTGENVVCEINSAPGLSSTESKNAWTNAWKGYFKEHNIR